jgi:hypothetical protein
MDELFWEKSLNDWKWLQKKNNYAQFMLFEIAHLTLKGKLKYWYKRIDFSLLDWATLKPTMESKYGVVDLEEIKVRLEIVKQKSKQRVQVGKVVH